MSGQEVDMGKWKGLFEWSMKHQQQGGGGAPPEALDPEKQAWLERALQDFMQDFVERMKQINASLSTPTTGATDSSTNNAPSLAEQEALCDELMEIVEHVDYARDLHKIGGLPTLLSLMSSPHPSLRWRAGELAATCMANNPPVQRWFMEGGAAPALMALLSDPHPVVATKALLGLSALVRHYQPGLEAFRLAGGLNKLLALLGCSTDAAVPSVQPQQPPADEQQQEQEQQRRRLLRKVLALLQYVLAKHPGDAGAAAQLGAVPRLAQLVLAGEADEDTRTASLAVLQQVVATPEGWARAQQQQVDGGGSLLAGLQQRLRQLQGGGGAGAEEDVEHEEERQLLAQVMALLSGPQPARAPAQGLQDHIEVDSHKDGGASDAKTLSLNARPDAAASDAGAASSGGAGLALMAVPKPELR